VSVAERGVRRFVIWNEPDISSDTYGYEFEGTRYDAGTTMGWLKASVELALQRPDLATEFREYLRDLPL